MLLFFLYVLNIADVLTFHTNLVWELHSVVGTVPFPLTRPVCENVEICPVSVFGYRQERSCVPEGAYA